MLLLAVWVVVFGLIVLLRDILLGWVLGFADVWDWRLLLYLWLVCVLGCVALLSVVGLFVWVVFVVSCGCWFAVCCW